MTEPARRAWAAGLALSVAGSLAAKEPSFSDATPGSGLSYRNVCGSPPGKKGWLNEGMGAGLAWLDYDRDGHLDLYLVNGSTFERGAGQGEPNRLYRGDGRGRFVDVTDKAGVADRGWGYGVAAGDVDNDGDTDLYVTRLGTNVLYVNNGDGTFRDATAKAGVGTSGWSTSAAFFDYDADGDLDLYVCKYMDVDPKKVPRRGSAAALATVSCTFKGIPVACGPLGQTPEQDVLYRNNGDGTFRDVTRAAGMWLDPPRYALGVVTGDFDNDGDPDVYVANDSVQASLWINRGDGTFTDAAVPMMAAFNADGRAQAGMGVDAGDYDGDGWLDLVKTNFSHDLDTLYHNAAGKFFSDEAGSGGLSGTYLPLAWGVAFQDLDNDGDLDLFIANGHVYAEVDEYKIGTSFRQKNFVYVNAGAKFQPAAGGPGLQLERSFRGAAFADYDDDGDVDVALTALDDAALLLRNDTAEAGHWLEVRLVGTNSNRDAVGTRVTVTAGGRAQLRERKGGGSYLSASDGRLHFGLGSAARADELQVRWPGGRRQTMSDVAADQILTLTEPR
ncbi:MAG TPA: CRTAC1 family protein [Candidatus Polarisedimenticolaceae bacterium]|nr:CRTAC1 family protein [Candidatus Polarisedimenticolaceae bacterium]